MAEATGGKAIPPTLGVESVLHGQTGTAKSGRRILRPTGAYNPLTFAEHGRAGATDFYQQRFQSDASNPLWKGYAREKGKNVTGILLDNDILLWIPLGRDLAGAKVLKLAEKKYPGAQVVGKFNLTGKPLSGNVPELALESGAESFDRQMDGLVGYFGRSLNWEERIVRLSVSYANGQRHFEGSLQEYLMPRGTSKILIP